MSVEALERPREGAVNPHNVRGAMWIFASAFFFVASISLVKFLGKDVPIGIQSFMRQAVFLAVLLPWILRDPVATFRTRQPGLFLTRGAATSASMVLGYYSYAGMPLAEANAISFSRVLWMVPLAMLLLGEKVPLARLLATAVGFAGVLLVLDPSGHGGMPFWPSASGILSAVVLAFSLTGVKALSRNHGQLALLAWAGVMGVVCTLPLAILDWRMPGARDALLLVVMGLFGAGGQFCYTRGISLGDASVVAPVDYTRIILSAIFGAVFFNELTPASTWAGVAVIVASTLFIGWHANRRGGSVNSGPETVAA